jgi:hypothetical protein
MVKEYGRSVVESQFCEHIKKYYIYFGNSCINLISVVLFLVIKAMLIFQKLFCNVEFVLFKMENMMAHTLKYLEHDMQHEMEKYMGLHSYCWSQYSDWLQTG